MGEHASETGQGKKQRGRRGSVTAHLSPLLPSCAWGMMEILQKNSRREGGERNTLFPLSPPPPIILLLQFFACSPPPCLGREETCSEK